MIHCPTCDKIAPVRPRCTVNAFGVLYKLYLCPHCGLQFWSPREHPDKGLYENEFEESSVLMLQRHTTGLQSISANHEAFLADNPEGGQRRLLDVGCGDGIFLQHAQDHGWTVWGIDLDGKSIEIGKRRGLERLYNQTLDGFLETARESQSVFDAITFFEVLEHQSDPMSFLKSLQHCLRNGGTIAGSVPNRNRFTLFTDRSGDLPPYHFTRWDPASLEAALRQAGYTNIKVHSIGSGYYLRNLTKPIKVWTKKLIARNVNPVDLAVRPIEKLEGVSNMTSARLRKLRALKTLKTALFAPLEAVEARIEKATKRGQMLYFQATWPGAITGEQT